MYVYGRRREWQEARRQGIVGEWPEGEDGKQESSRVTSERQVREREFLTFPTLLKNGSAAALIIDISYLYCSRGIISMPILISKKTTKKVRIMKSTRNRPISL